jgi:[protein-PII] uridylyltransferase
LAAARRKLLSDGLELDAAELGEAWLDLTESWLTAKAAEIGITDTSGESAHDLTPLEHRQLGPFLAVYRYLAA